MTARSCSPPSTWRCFIEIGLVFLCNTLQCSKIDASKAIDLVRYKLFACKSLTVGSLYRLLAKVRSQTVICTLLRQLAAAAHMLASQHSLVLISSSALLSHEVYCPAQVAIYMCTMVCIRVTSLRDCLLMVDASALPQQHADALQSNMLWRLEEQLEWRAHEQQYAILKSDCPALDAEVCFDVQDIYALASGLKVRRLHCVAEGHTTCSSSLHAVVYHIWYVAFYCSYPHLDTGMMLGVCSCVIMW